MSNTPIKFNKSCIKTLSAVEARPDKSNQHELNGIKQLKEILGITTFNRTAKFSIRGTNISCLSEITWYDAREAHPVRSEHRLYFQTNKVMSEAREGDNVLVGIDSKDELHIVLLRIDSISNEGAITDWITT